MKQWNNHVLEVIRYFAFFNYPPTFEDIYTFLRKKCSKRRLARILGKMRRENFISAYRHSGKRTKFAHPESDSGQNAKHPQVRIKTRFWTSQNDNMTRYTLTQYQSTTNNFTKRLKISNKKINKMQHYVKLLSLFPQIKLVGLSGSVAMLNADESHDMDLFIITAKNRLWTGRFIALLLGQVMGIRRKRADNRSTFHVPRFRDKVCLNLFFDESDLVVPKFKRSEYVAHEVLQMEPLEQKDGMYLRFIDANRWVFDIFPNARKVVSSQKIVVGKEKVLATNYLLLSTFGNILEFLLKKLQLFFISRHRTNEIVTASQLWFHPEDFGEKMKFNS